MGHRLQLKDAFKRFTQDQDKVLSPGETVFRFKEKLKETRLNILGKTVRIDTGRLGIPVYISYFGPDAQGVAPTRKQMGKGATPEQAEASAVMELAERFSFFSFMKNPPGSVTSPYRHVKHQALSFREIAQSVHDESADQEILEPFFSTLPLKWIPAYNLTQNREAMIPIDWFYMINEFNGSCAGNCPEEALCQGISEVVERHVSARISGGRITVPAIRPESSRDPMAQEMLRKYAAAGVTIHLSDFTLDTGIPTVGVLAWDPSTFPETSEIVWTAGTTPGPEKALSRALTETAQLGGNFNTRANYVASGLPKFSRIEDASYIIRTDSVIDLDSLPNLSDDNIRVEIENLVSALRRLKMDVYAVDMTHPALGVPAYYIIIPGTYFRERSRNSSVGLFLSKLIAETMEPDHAAPRLVEMADRLPGRYYIFFQLGATHLKMGDPESALGYFRKSLDLSPPESDIPSILSYTAASLKEMGRYEEALTLLEKGVALDPDRTDLHNLMGFCLFKLKRHEKAIQSFEAVLRLDPGSAIDYANIASNYRDMGDTGAAIAYYEMALDMDPALDFARENVLRLKGR